MDGCLLWSSGYPLHASPKPIKLAPFTQCFGTLLAEGEGVPSPGLKHNDSPEPSFHTRGFDSTAELIKVHQAKKDQESSHGLGTLS